MLYFHDLSTVLNVSRCSRHYKKQKIKTHIHEMLIVVNVVSYVIFDDLLGALCNQEKLLY